VIGRYFLKQFYSQPRQAVNVSDVFDTNAVRAINNKRHARDEFLKLVVWVEQFKLKLVIDEVVTFLRLPANLFAVSLKNCGIAFLNVPVPDYVANALNDIPVSCARNGSTSARVNLRETREPHASGR
jgi:hypothetical protein